MTDFHYDVEKTNHYYIDDITIYGKSVQDGTPTPSSPIPVQVVEPVSGDSIYLNCGDEQIAIDMQGNVLASLPDGTRDDLTIDSTGHVTIEKNVGNIFVDGSTKTAFNVSTLVGKQHILIDMGAGSLASDVNSVYVMCDKLPGLSANQEYLGNTGISSASDRFLRFCCDEIQSITTTSQANTWLQANALNVYYKLATPQTVDLNPIDLPSNADEPYTVSVTASITPETAINQTNKPTYEVENPYEHIPGAKMEIPPVHPLMQEWETFDPDNWDEQTMMDYTYQNEWHAVYTVYLGELMQSGVFDWSRPELNWRDAAIDDEQYQRVCDYFNLRFKWREISMLPVLKWFDYLYNKLVYELMPKYKPLYERVAEGVNPLSSESEYYKNRTIESAYPETLLSENADYITDGKDEEFQRIKEHGTADAIVNFADVYKGVDQLLLDELEVMFVSLYTTNINGL